MSSHNRSLYLQYADALRYPGNFAAAVASFQVPFESQFEGWSGGSKNNGMTCHFKRFGEGNYTCSGGWPSLKKIP